MPLNRRVVAVAYDGLCTFEFGVAAELFGLPRPEMGDNWYSFDVVSPDPSPLRTLGGITLSASSDLAAIEAAGTVVLPGWRDPNERPSDELLAALRRAHGNGARLMSICSGVFVLAATGLLDGQRATTHWRYTDQLQREHPEIDVQPDVLYVDNGTLLTSAGSAAGLDLGLHLIRRDFGPDHDQRPWCVPDGQLRSNVLSDLVEVHGAAGRRHDDGDQLVAPLGVRAPGHRNLGHRRQLGNAPFCPFGPHLLAAGSDDFARPPEHSQAAVLGECAEVAGWEPAVVVLGVDVFGGGSVGPQQHRTANEDLVVIGDAELGTVDRAPLVDDARPGLGHAVGSQHVGRSVRWGSGAADHHVAEQGRVDVGQGSCHQ